MTKPNHMKIRNQSGKLLYKLLLLLLLLLLLALTESLKGKNEREYDSTL